MILSRESQYGLEGLIVLARQPRGRVMLLQQLAQAGHLPAGFLARTLQRLRRHNLVASHRGAIRGYSLARPAHEITLREIFEAIEGPTVFRRCICSSRRSGEGHRCRLHDDWAPIGARLLTVMEETTLAQVASRNAKHR
ncbi:MAG TPA: Rrf2 family transcriptional regulator [Candidatus Nitrosotalea sp.]|nr:Rrf2 family transcriptional regulator [Candidatus Nitrosotalea sp.]